VTTLHFRFQDQSNSNEMEMKSKITMKNDPMMMIMSTLGRICRACCEIIEDANDSLEYGMSCFCST